MKVQVNTHLDPHVVQWLETHALRVKRTRAHVVTLAVEAYLTTQAGEDKPSPVEDPAQLGLFVASKEGV